MVGRRSLHSLVPPYGFRQIENQSCMTDSLDFKPPDSRILVEGRTILPFSRAVGFLC
jgi:hypothetical protein